MPWNVGRNTTETIAITQTCTPIPVISIPNNGSLIQNGPTVRCSRLPASAFGRQCLRSKQAGGVSSTSDALARKALIFCYCIGLAIFQEVHLLIDLLGPSSHAQFWTRRKSCEVRWYSVVDCTEMWGNPLWRRNTRVTSLTHQGAAD